MVILSFRENSFSHSKHLRKKKQKLKTIKNVFKVIVENDHLMKYIYLLFRSVNVIIGH